MKGVGHVKALDVDLFTNPVLASFESENDLFQFFTDYITMTGICCVYYVTTA